MNEAQLRALIRKLYHEAISDDKDEVDEIKKWAGKQVELDFYGDETIIQEKKSFQDCIGDKIFTCIL